MRNIFIVASGTAGAQAITMAFAPFITRLYGPEAFGALGSFMAILAVLAPVAALTYPIAIVLPKEDVEAKGLVKLSLFLSMLVSGVTALFISVWGEALTKILGLQGISGYLYLIPLAMLFSGFQQVAEGWLIRFKAYGVIARVAVLQSCLANTAKVAVGYYYALPLILVILHAASIVLQAVLLCLGAKRIKVKGSFKGGLSKVKKLSFKYRDFAIFRTPEVSINSASQSLPIIVLAALFGPASAGFYALGRMVVGVPAGLVGKAVGDVIYPRISDAANLGEPIFPLVYKATWLLTIVGFLPFCVVMVFGPELFSLVFGSEWGMAGDYARWLALWLFVGLVNAPAVKAIPVIGMQGFQLLYTCVMLFVRILVLLVGYWAFNDDLIAVAVFGVSGAVLNAFLILVVFHGCRRFDLRCLSSMR